MARMPWRDACRLDNSLASLDHFFQIPPDYAQTLPGGLTNHCWKIALVSGEQYVWRPDSQMLKAFSISRYQEHRILSSLADSNLAPKPFLVNAAGLLVEWIEGENAQEDFSNDALLTLYAQVHSLETSNIAIAPFNYTARVDHYWIQIKPELKSTTLETLYQQWRASPAIPEVDLSLCHFDLGHYNIVQTPDGDKIIDWEYASLSDPRLDLALALNLTSQPTMDSVYQYCQLRGVEGVDDWVEGVLQWQPRGQLMALLWYLLAYQLKGEQQYLDSAGELEQLLVAE
ncbi:phosphotransferase [Vibrio sp. S4M6]|uniref:phosphotransferase n=1 Tax=Vibrio sinus TaxID=2946865 RepID=UPI002029E0D0|nr:phosphotransferase [Vibrio sinus]MCL9782292.1 phosphotransferase [Vibrio sinus]